MRLSGVHRCLGGLYINVSNLPGQQDIRQGIITGMAGETGHRSNYIL